MVTRSREATPEHNACNSLFLKITKKTMRALTLMYKPLSLELDKIISRAFTSIGLPT
jgi:hypothetical protein